MRRLGNPSTLKDNMSFYLTSTSMKVIYRFPGTFQVRYSHLFFMLTTTLFPRFLQDNYRLVHPFCTYRRLFQNQNRADSNRVTFTDVDSATKV